MNKLAVLPLIALASACAPAEPMELSAAEQTELTAALRGYTPKGNVDCISQSNLRGNRSIGEGVILFEGLGNTLYVNRPPAGCPDLRGTRTLIIRSPSSQFCRGEIVEVVDLQSNVSYGSCGLGSFDVYEEAG